MSELDLLEEVATIVGWWAVVGMLALIVIVISVQKKFFAFDKYTSQPSVGPADGSMMRSKGEHNGKEKFVLKLKNFGELQAKNIIICYISQNQEITLDTFNDSKIIRFNLGPLLPNMEKSYYFFINSESLQQAKKRKFEIFIGIYILYESFEDKKGYGLTARYDINENAFVIINSWDKNLDSHGVTI